MSTIKGEFTFSPRILEHLGISAYNSVRKCLAELVANAYDADARHVHIHVPIVIDENARIILKDDGMGMSPEDLKAKFLHIGRDRREDGDRTPSNRLVIGSKGIGKLAGFGIASRLRVTTCHRGKQSSITINKSDLDSVYQLTGHQFDIIVTDTDLNNGTIIELLQLHKELHLPSEEVIRRHLYKSMPSRTDFAIYVNETECSAEDSLGKREDFIQTIPGIGEAVGYYIIANTRQDSPGLSVRVRGRIVQEPSLFGLSTRAHGFFTAEKIVGEINADFLDPENSIAGKLDLIKTSRDGFLEDSDIVREFNDWAGGFVRQIVQGAEEGEATKRTTAIMATPEVRSRLDALPPHIRSAAASVVRGIISKLGTASDEDAKNLVEWILRYYESNMLKELMGAIAAADIHEAEKLAGLVSEWGLSQLNSIVGIIQTQINIIQRLEELVLSDQVYEIDLHKLVESNLWLVKEGLELWSSDKPLKTVLGGHVDDLYKDRQWFRPDLICRSRNDGNEAIILEFKRPKEVVALSHVTQALGYAGIIKKHRPNINLVIYVVGREYDSGVLSIKDNQANAGLYLYSFGEILQRARARFEDVLKILGR